MAGSAQYSVTSSSAVLLASAPPSSVSHAVGWAYVATNNAIHLGGSTATTTSNGAAVAANGTLQIVLYPGDSIYAIADSTTATVTVLQTGA